MLLVDEVFLFAAGIPDTMQFDVVGSIKSGIFQESHQKGYIKVVKFICFQFACGMHIRQPCPG